MSEERDHSLDRQVDRIELSEEEFKTYIEQHGCAPLDFDGYRYTYPIKLKGVVWHKPVGFIDHDGKFYKLVDR